MERTEPVTASVKEPEAGSAAAGSETTSSLPRFPRSMSPASRADVICEA